MLSLTPYDKAHRYLIMDRAYEGDRTRLLAINRGYIPVVPPKRNRKSPWEYSRELYKQRNTVERFFLRIKRFRKIFTRYDKLDIIFSGFILFAMIITSSNYHFSSEIYSIIKKLLIILVAPLANIIIKRAIWHLSCAGINGSVFQ